MTETPAEKKAQYWCYDGSSWRLIDDPMPDISSDQTVFQWYFYEGFQLLVGPGEPDDNYDGPHISLWTRHSKPECVIYISHGVSGGGATVYADRLPDGIDLFTRWAPAIYGHGREPESGETGHSATVPVPGLP